MTEEFSKLLEYLTEEEKRFLVAFIKKFFNI